ncbi:hypothetical protein KAFR_0H02070 [Kazachstania africana CBS 2517]|uniref:Protein STB3 n=1 Tax=Kazachstania africana (strain ATCC 22294 / BCRC 22015 / CBS 2517 / CECT 1963 / NBRC 1671 / NRRL Y-8276) TaxID=1071382 RepID=H2AZ60_KAZAF|nr:hypothetical protein KAFR_0H02070 [Kazachstania africana CBS 2517]CCF59616.1 hypothetical protein KAFR_0H02070 [Kazachstania africana CBS 2517]
MAERHKPLAITSVEAQTAAQMITPQRISSILETNGPMAIRFITQRLSEDVPYFKDLSTSKQRRLIMHCMELGDEPNSMIFEKIGWGQWSIKKVNPEDFSRERSEMNKLNLKVRDSGVEHETRKKGNTVSKKKTLHSPSHSPLQRPVVPHVIYIDENALASDGESEYESDLEDDIHQVKNESNGIYTFNRRKSSVVYDEASSQFLEKGLIAEKMRPLMKNRSRRSSSKTRTRLPRIIYNDKQPVAINDSDIVSTKESRSFSEPISRRSSSGLSFTKESGIRSTLFSDHSVNNSNNGAIFRSPQIVYQNLDLSMSDNEMKPAVVTTPSDTEDEDWEDMGPAQLRRQQDLQVTDAANALLSLNHSTNNNNAGNNNR